MLCNMHELQDMRASNPMVFWRGLTLKRPLHLELRGCDHPCQLKSVILRAGADYRYIVQVTVGCGTICMFHVGGAALGAMHRDLVSPQAF